MSKYERAWQSLHWQLKGRRHGNADDGAGRSRELRHLRGFKRHAYLLGWREGCAERCGVHYVDWMITQAVKAVCGTA